MREIQPEHIHARLDQFKQLFIAVAGWPNGGYDFCSVGGMFLPGIVVHFLVKVFANIFAHNRCLVRF